jgi:hypothetical protein
MGDILGQNFYVHIRNAACEQSSVKWNFNTNSSFALGQRKAMERLDQDLPDAY